MPNLNSERHDDAANPLQPGDPFRRKNFNRFAFGMCLLIAAFLVVAILFLHLSRNHQATTTPAHPSSALRVPLPLLART